MKKIELNTARNCLRYVIKAFDIKEIYIPYYNCQSLRNAVFKENCKIKFYHIDKNFYPKENFDKNSFILYTNYFGICDDIVDKLARKYDNLITDNAHSFYSEPKGIASFYSLRKFFPNLKDGAFLYTTKTLNENIPQDEYQYDTKEMSFEELCKNEKRLDYEDIKIINKNTKKYFSKIDTEIEKIKRLENFKNWNKLLEKTNLLKISPKMYTIPFAYPYLASSEKEANELASDLKLRGINIFRYWNNLPESYEEKVFYKNLIVIPSVIENSKLKIYVNKL